MDHNDELQITRGEAFDILEKGLPNLEDLNRFPFGNILYSLWTKDNNNFEPHGRKVLASMNQLLANNPEKIIKGRLDSDTQIAFRNNMAVMSSCLGGFNDDIKFLFRLAALYHDIGKYIIKERHPTIGRYTMEYLEPKQRNNLRTLLENREDFLQLLLVMVRDHDQFGVISTGEGSYPILLGAATSLGSSIEEQAKTISAILLLNLADIAGVPKLDVTSEDLKKTMDDWQWYMDALNACSKNPEQLADYVINHACTEDAVIRRISRLLLESSRRTKRYEELKEKSPDTKEYRVIELVRNQLHTVYPTAGPRKEFAFEFTHVCKLDYGKRFFEALVDYCEGPMPMGNNRPLKSWEKERVDLEKYIYAVLAILRRITSTYRTMIRTESGSGSLIGIEMKDLTPENAPEKTAQICKLLLDSHYPGLSWIMSDCPAWYF